MTPNDSATQAADGFQQSVKQGIKGIRFLTRFSKNYHRNGGFCASSLAHQAFYVPKLSRGNSCSLRGHRPFGHRTAPPYCASTQGDLSQRVQVANIFGLWSQIPLKVWYLEPEYFNIGSLDPLGMGNSSSPRPRCNLHQVIDPQLP